MIETCDDELKQSNNKSYSLWRYQSKKMVMTKEELEKLNRGHAKLLFKIAFFENAFQERFSGTCSKVGHPI